VLVGAGQDLGRDRRAEGPSLQLVERMGGDADGQTEAEQGAEEPDPVDVGG
jgi:hypothetical protein